MKTIRMISFILALCLSGVSYANDGKYVQAMQKNIQALNEAKTTADLQNVINTFERIGNAEKSKWEPHYYTGLAYVTLATREQDATQKDALLDQAMAAVNKAKAIVPDESEIITLEGYVLTIRVTVDPASRGPVYAPQAMQALGKAISLNPNNPRALGLMAQMQFGTAQFFGSPATEACQLNGKALEKFDTYKSDNVLAPEWGRKMSEALKGKCQ